MSVPSTQPAAPQPSAAHRGSFFDGSPKLTTVQRSELQRHVINLNLGHFSTDGQWNTSLAEVEAIFGDYLPEWIDAREKKSDPVPVLLYAHGGLVDESSGLQIAANQVKWWKANGVYPVFFVWETGFLETLRQIFFGAERRFGIAAGSRGRRGFFDELEDRAWETAARTLGGVGIWSAMKSSAERTFQNGGDGRKILEALKTFAGKHKDRLKLHAVGHSAGSIFLSHAAVAAKQEKLPKFETVHFLAPAISNDLFKDTLMPLVGGKDSDQVERLSVFTMDDARELADTTGPYDKSLLYLVYNALEAAKDTPILGLQRSLLNDNDVAKFFGLRGHRNNSRTAVILSSETASPNRPEHRRSDSRTHGGFDNDSQTMFSVLLRVLGLKSSNGRNLTPFPPSAAGRAAIQLPRSAAELAGFGMPGSAGPAVISQEPGGNGETVKAKVTQQTVAPISGNGQIAFAGGGNNRAVCIGINQYSTSPLSGCVSDAQRWAAWLSSCGFSVTSLVDGQATHAEILRALRDLVRSASAGDTIAIQYAGHGTQVPDSSGDESTGDTPGKDEALVPIDFMASGMLLDDDLAEVCRGIKDGVQVYFFMDCCHSGTNTRLFISKDSGASPAADIRMRYLPLTQAMLKAHRAARQARTNMRSLNPYTGKTEILMAACRSQEVAWESHGSGDFTRHALDTLAQAPAGLTCRQFIDQVLVRFGTSRRQTPELWCDPARENTPLPSPQSTAPAPAPAQVAVQESAAQLKTLLQQLLQALNSQG